MGTSTRVFLRWMRLTALLRMTSHVKESLALITSKVSSAYKAADPSVRSITLPRLVAVSKTKPKELIIEAYQAGQRDFGENYVQELVEKSSDADISLMCPEIRWHFIGNCQSKKVKDLIKCPRLKTIETVTSAKLATQLNSRAEGRDKETPINVFVQVNTSGEESKNGLQPGDEVVQVVKLILDKCPNLKFSGLMTIGDLGNSKASGGAESGENPDFKSLREQRNRVSEVTGLEASSIELSMGMSQDFEAAIGMGSTNVRVGSSIFGARSYPPSSEKSAGTVEGDEAAVGVENVTLKMDKVSM